MDAGHSAVHVSRMSQPERVIVQNDTSVTAGCSLDAGRQEEPRSEALVRRDMNKRSSARFSGYFSRCADIDRRLDVGFSISSVELFAVINPLSAFQLFLDLRVWKCGTFDEYISETFAVSSVCLAIRLSELNKNLFGRYFYVLSLKAVIF